jgi:hypothetical protein
LRKDLKVGGNGSSGSAWEYQGAVG